jgi:TPR repeat protein
MVVTSGRNKRHQPESESGSRFSPKRVFRGSCVALAVLAVVSAGLLATRAVADYADGNRTAAIQSTESAVKVWRQAAWQRDDYFSQLQLGTLYSNQDSGFFDPVEAYVWYFLALRPERTYYTEDYNVQQDLYTRQQNAIGAKQALYDSLSPEQKLQARARIIYILASRGAEGFITLAQIHRQTVSQSFPTPQGCGCYCHDPMWYFWPVTWFRKLWYQYPPDSVCEWRLRDKIPAGKETVNGCESAAYTDECPGNQQGQAGQAGQAGQWGQNNGAGLQGTPQPYVQDTASVIMPDNVETLMYLFVAAKKGHPLAATYIGSVESDMTYGGGDISYLIARAKARATTFALPFEFYPGTTQGGIPHSDEGLPEIEERIALARIRELPFGAVEQALVFRGLLRGFCDVRNHQPGCPQMPGPTPLPKAVAKFQGALGFEADGFLKPAEAVRLIRMNALDGDKIAQNRLGIMYAKGIGVAKNFVKAEYWFQLAAKQNYGEAYYNLGVLYKVGVEGVPQDKDKATRNFVDAARFGFPPARCEIQELLNGGGGNNGAPVGGKQ